MNALFFNNTNISSGMVSWWGAAGRLALRYKSAGSRRARCAMRGPSAAGAATAQPAASCSTAAPWGLKLSRRGVASQAGPLDRLATEARAVHEHRGGKTTLLSLLTLPLDRGACRAGRRPTTDAGLGASYGGGALRRVQLQRSPAQPFPRPKCCPVQPRD